MRAVDLSIVTYAPDFALLEQLLASLLEATRAPLARHLFIHDNSPDASVAERLGSLPAVQPGRGFDRVEIRRGEANVGFGRGHNANAALGSAPWLLVVNPDCILEPGALEGLVNAAVESADDVAAWEPRQLPYEHPKAYDPATLEAPWVSGAAALFRRSAFEEVAGFEPRIFMYAEDVDLSWRLRARGWRLLAQPRLAVVHRTYRIPGEAKPLQVFGGVTGNLCLRARFGGILRTLQGLAMLGAEIVAPQRFAGRRRGLLLAGMRFLARWPYFAFTRVHASGRFHPFFAGWNFELRREGAFHHLPTAAERRARPQPLVSILIRTIDRPEWLREALQSCANQTYPNLEVVVIEDGAERSRSVVEEFAARMTVRYRATGHRLGRARAGNLALAEARGELLNFLDDDDLLFADHVEVLVDAIQRRNVPGAYALSWETQVEKVPGTFSRGNVPGTFSEVMHVTRHWHRFDRITLWHHNFLPIQAVMFHRRLYERYGGFAEDMDQLEDWNLWTRYTLEDEFVLVDKTTSKYRVPASAVMAADRQARLDHAYADAIERQRAMQVTFSPREISEMADSYARSQSLVMVTRDDLRRFVGASRLTARMAAYRPFAGRVLRRLGWRR